VALLVNVLLSIVERDALLDVEAQVEIESKIDSSSYKYSSQPINEC